MGNRITRIIAIVFLLVTLICPQVSANGFNRGVIEHVDATMPNITAFVNILNDTNDILPYDDIEKNSITAMLDDKILEVTDIVSYNDSSLGMTFFFLVDISGSVNRDFKNVKESLKNWINSINENEKVVLITFGDSVEIALDGTETKQEALEVVDEIKSGNQNTLYFDGIYRALNIATSTDNELPSRKVFIVITDGDDYSKGGVTSDELSDKLIEIGIPMYSVMVSTSKDENISSSGELSRKTGGKMVLLENDKNSDELASLHQELNSGYVISMKAENNLIDNTAKTLNIVIDSQDINFNMSKEIIISNYIYDDTLPAIESVKASGSREIIIKYSEDVTGASNLANFTLSTDDDQIITVLSCNYDNLTTKVVLDEDIYNGSYKISTKNVFDVSMEKNEIINQQYNFTVTNIPKVSDISEDTEMKTIDYKSISWIYYAIGVALFVLGAIFIINRRFNAKKKRINAVPGVIGGLDKADGDNGNIITPPIIKNNGTKIDIIITNENGNERIQEVYIDQFIVIGRSESCNVTIDDDEMSRQHCKLVYDEVLFIVDLNSTNGTEVNGKLIDGPTTISFNDYITVGGHKIRCKI